MFGEVGLSMLLHTWESHIGEGAYNVNFDLKLLEIFFKSDLIMRLTTIQNNEN